ncbi:Hypothetical_protein [Hexamita inflata]|uniref:Hypothetical_protein n=1 Tax=Hexamita inflata TaxID=28002 RepID=A0AA86S1R5_9EUKA|nr:Hypothetical protein HINF_LOCUS64135 [Hexamita inflata]
MYNRRTSAAKVKPTTRVQASRGVTRLLHASRQIRIHLRRTICVSKEAMERLPLSNPDGLLMAEQNPGRRGSPCKVQLKTSGTQLVESRNIRQPSFYLKIHN